MLQPTLTHYAPWDETEEHGLCGAPLLHPSLHSPMPTCPTCAAILDYQDHRAEADAVLDAIDNQAVPLDAEEAAIDLAPAASMSPLGAQLFAFAGALNAVYATALKGRR